MEIKRTANWNTHPTDFWRPLEEEENEKIKLRSSESGIALRMPNASENLPHTHSAPMNGFPQHADLDTNSTIVEAGRTGTREIAIPIKSENSLCCRCKQR